MAKKPANPAPAARDRAVKSDQVTVRALRNIGEPEGRFAPGDTFTTTTARARALGPRLVAPIEVSAEEDTQGGGAE